MKQWSKRFFSSTRGRVVQLLRREKASVSDLAEALKLTDNAVRSHLSTLERDGLVEEAGKRPGVRRPEILYALSPEADQLFPHAYDLIFSRLLDVLEGQLSPAAVENVLREVGARLAADQDPRAASSLRLRLDQALSALQSMGGLADLDERDDHFLIQGYSCPLTAAVRHHPEVCRLAESLLAEIVKTPVQEICDRSGGPRCAFRVAKENGHV